MENPEENSPESAIIEEIRTLTSIEPEQLTAEQRGRLQELFTRGEELRRDRMFEAQESLAGKEQLARDFVRLSDVEEVPGTRLSGEKLRRHLWKALPSSPFKRFQQAHTPPERIIVPAFSMNGESVHWNNRLALSSVEMCPADPDALPDKLMEDMHLVSFEENEDDESRRMKKLGVLPAYRKIWNTARPVRPKNYRIMVLTEPELAGTLLYTKAGPADPDDHRDEKRYGQKPRKATVQLFHSAYDFDRKTAYTSKNYEQNDIDKLSSLMNAAQILVDNLEVEWTAGADEEQKLRLIADAHTLESLAQDILAGARNEHKVRARMMIEGAQELIDGRKVGAAMSKITAAINAADERQTEVENKSGFNDHDRTAIRMYISRKEDQSKRTRTAVQENASTVQRAADENNPALLPHAARMMRRGFGYESKHRSDLQIKPFITYDNAIRTLLSELDDAAQSGQTERAADTVVRLHVTGKLQALGTCIQRLKERIANPDNASIEQIRMYMKRIGEILHSREVFPERVNEAFADLFEQLSDAVDQLQIWVQELDEDKDGENREKILAVFRDELDTFDLEGDVRQLMERTANPSKPR